MENQNAVRRRTYAGNMKCYCYYDYTCHIVCYWARRLSLVSNIPCGIKHIVADNIGETVEEKYAYEDIKLFVSITTDIDRLMKAWARCILAETNKEFIGNFCGKIGAIKDIDVDGSSEIEFLNYQCYLPNDCCTILGEVKDKSLISSAISSHLD